MTATLIDGKAVSQQVRAELRDEIEAWVAGGGRRPGLATVLVGEDPASAVYVRNKQKACGEVGIEGFAHDLPADSTRSRSSSCSPSSTPTNACPASCSSCRRRRTSTART